MSLTQCAVPHARMRMHSSEANAAASRAYHERVKRDESGAALPTEADAGEGVARSAGAAGAGATEAGATGAGAGAAATGAASAGKPARDGRPPGRAWVG